MTKQKQLKKGKITLISLTQNPIDMGLRLLSSILKENGFHVNKIFLRERMEADISLGVVRQVDEIAKKSLFIGICMTTDDVMLAKKLAQKLKLLNKDAVLVGGGVHPTVRPNEILDFFDFAVKGEAEQTILKLSDELLKGHKIEDIRLSAVDTKYYKSNEIGFIKDIDDLPFPDFSDYFVLKGNKIIFERDYKYLFGGTYSILTNRGCPYGCTYCANNFYLKRTTNKFFRKRSISKIIDELKFAKEEYKIKEILVLSDNFLAMSDGEFDDFISQYKKEINLPFCCCATPNLINEDHINELIKIGLFSISTGIESGSENILRQYKRFFYKPQKIVETAKILNKFYPNLTYSFDLILGNPYETKEDISKTISLLEEIPRTCSLTLFSLTFYPGTELYDKAVKDGFVKDAYYLKEPKYYHKLNNSFYNSILLLYSFKINPKLVAYFMKCESSKNILDKVCKIILSNSTNSLLSLGLLVRVLHLIRTKNRAMTFHFIKLGLSVIKKEVCRKINSIFNLV